MKYIYDFKEGNTDKTLVGGKGAGLAEMMSLGIPVPSGFTITTNACNLYYANKKVLSNELITQIKEHIHTLEMDTGKIFGSFDKPMLVSVRSGARSSMPGMMDTILNLGLNDEIVDNYIKVNNDARFINDAYRRLIMMYSDVVKECDKSNYEDILANYKKEHNYNSDIDLTGDDLSTIVSLFKEKYKELTKEEFPQDVYVQLINAVGAVFNSWNNKRAVYYRKLNNIPDDWGTAVNIVLMVYGNKNNNSGTGVAFSRNPNTGEAKIFGEYLINAQGEDVVAGVRTPDSIDNLKEKYPTIYEEFSKYATILENHFLDMQDMEFTIEDGKLYILQTRSGKRTGMAAVKICDDLVKEGKISKEDAIMRLTSSDIINALHPTFLESSLKNATLIGNGLPASSGACSGKIVFKATDAIKASKEGIATILVREETSPEDIEGMHYANGVLTLRGGMTSHAAVVARGMGTCCVSGSKDFVIKNNTLISKNGLTINYGDEISLDGNTGNIYLGKLEVSNNELSPALESILEYAKEIKRLGIKANADTKNDALLAKKLGAEGVGLVRTEHMFFDKQRIFDFRKMILSSDKKMRVKALLDLIPYQEKDFEDILSINDGKRVIIRYLDPPLHEFLPKEDSEIENLATALKMSKEDIYKRINELKEFNPMMGHRGCRLDITYPEIALMQTTAIIEAACKCTLKGIKVDIGIMIPLVIDKKEFNYIKDIVDFKAKEIIAKHNIVVKYDIGSMIETPRAAILTDELASTCNFFSYGTNDLTQLTFGFSRDDTSKFINDYYKKDILSKDPFMEVDTNGLGKLLKVSVRLARMVNPNISLGVCGEHAANENSIIFFDKIGLDYISASSYRVPVAIVAAAKAKIINERKKI